MKENEVTFKYKDGSIEYKCHQCGGYYVIEPIGHKFNYEAIGCICLPHIEQLMLKLYFHEEI